MYDVSENRVVLDQDHYNRDIHCLMDLIDIEDPDVANMLIDMQSIESVVLIARDADARNLMSDRYRVPRNCRIAYTKEGNTYYPDPNYKSYAGRVGQKARYLQVSVEETIRYSRLFQLSSFTVNGNVDSAVSWRRRWNF